MNACANNKSLTSATKYLLSTNLQFHFKAIVQIKLYDIKSHGSKCLLDVMNHRVSGWILLCYHISYMIFNSEALLALSLSDQQVMKEVLQMLLFKIESDYIKVSHDMISFRTSWMINFQEYYNLSIDSFFTVMDDFDYLFKFMYPDCANISSSSSWSGMPGIYYYWSKIMKIFSKTKTTIVAAAAYPSLTTSYFNILKEVVGYPDIHSYPNNSLKNILFDQGILHDQVLRNFFKVVDNFIDDSNIVNGRVEFKLTTSNETCPASSLSKLSFTSPAYENLMILHFIQTYFFKMHEEIMMSKQSSGSSISALFDIMSPKCIVESNISTIQHLESYLEGIRTVCINLLREHHEDHLLHSSLKDIKNAIFDLVDLKKVIKLDSCFYNININVIANV